jgi:hypothetical protein
MKEEWREKDVERRGNGGEGRQNGGRREGRHTL